MPDKQAPAGAVLLGACLFCGIEQSLTWDL